MDRLMGALRASVIVTGLGCAPAAPADAAPPHAEKARAPAQETAMPDPPNEVTALLARAAAAPHNGTNPQIDVDTATLERLAPALEGTVAERAARGAGCVHRRDAASLLARLDPRPRHAFWAGLLEHPDLAVRFLAITKLADVADPADFERVARQAVAAPALQHVLSVRLRDWKDPRALAVLAELLDGPHAANAALSMSLLPGVPQLPPDRAPATHEPSGAWVAHTDAVAPYRRWWQEQGAAQHAAERAWWAALRARTAPDTGLQPAEPCQGG